MKRSKFSETQIITLLRRHEAGEKVRDLSREAGISEPTFYNWKSKYGGLSVSELKRIKDLEQENARLKRMYADLSLVHEALKDAIEKKL
jgi:putative transposase